MIKKFPPVSEKMSENRRGDFLTHTVYASGRLNICLPARLPKDGNPCKVLTGPNAVT